MSYCSQCGNENPDTGGFCIACGAKLGILPSPENSAPPGSSANLAAEDTVSFYCTACSQKIEAPSEMAGSEIDCPSCSTHIQVPKPRSVLNPPPVPPLQPSLVSRSVPPVLPQPRRRKLFLIPIVVIAIVALLIGAMRWWPNIVAQTAKDSKVRYEAVQKLTDQTVLARIALRDANGAVRCAAVQKLKDQPTLLKVALQESGDMTYCAILGLTEQPLLARLLIETTNSGDVHTVHSTRERFTDQTLLAKIVAEARLVNNRVWAVGQMTEQGRLRQLAENHPFTEIRQAAVRGITDDGFLLRQLSVEPSARVRTTIVETLHQEESLTYVYLHAYHEQDRSLALTRSNDPEKYAKSMERDGRVFGMGRDTADSRMLLSRALEGELDVIRSGAAKRLEDPGAIEQAALRSRDRDVLSILLAKIEDDAALRRIAEGAEDQAMRLAAAQKAGVRSWQDIFSGVTGEGAPAVKLQDALAAMSLFQNEQPDAKKGLQTVYLTLIRRGDDSQLPELSDLLQDFGDKEMAEYYLNCGRLNLVQLAKDWASHRGYTVGKRGEQYGDPRPKDGFWRPVVLPGAMP